MFEEGIGKRSLRLWSFAQSFNINFHTSALNPPIDEDENENSYIMQFLFFFKIFQFRF